MKRPKKLGTLKLVLPFAAATLTILLFRMVFFLGYTPTASMAPAIPANSFLFGYRLYGTLQRDDIIIFKRDGHTVIKRIAAIPGDTVYDYGTQFSLEYRAGALPVAVPEDCYFVLGDNTAESYDSRFWAEPFVVRKDILAKYAGN